MAFYYILVFLLMLVSGRWCVTENNRLLPRNIGIKIASFAIIFISCFRFNIGYDWSQYYAKMYPIFKFDAVDRFEPLNKLIFYICSIFNSPLLFFSIYAIVTYSVIFYCFHKYSTEWYTSFIIYLSLFYLPSLSIIRQAIAIAIVFWGYKYIIEKKIIRYILVCLFATMFHTSGLIGILIILVYYFPLVPYFMIMIIGTLSFKTILLKVFGSLGSYYLFYLSDTGGGGNSTKIFYLFLFCYCFFIFLIFPPLRSDKEYGSLLKVISVGTVFPFILGGHTGVRLGSYFFIYISLLIPKANKYFNIHYRCLYLALFYIYFFLYLYITTKTGSTDYVPYKFYFLKDLN